MFSFILDLIIFLVALYILLFVRKEYLESTFYQIDFAYYRYFLEEIAYITAIMGSYETTAKKFVKQSIPVDKFCFTNNENIKNEGEWKIDINKYYLTNPSPIDNGNYTNSLSNNNHTFNIAKYFKQQFYLIPSLQKYRYIIWLDGSIEVDNPETTFMLIKIFNKYPQYNMITWEHHKRKGLLSKEVRYSHFFRYTSTFWNGQKQPYQDVDAQYKFYIKNGFKERKWPRKYSYRKYSKNIGVWYTPMIAFDMKDPRTKKFLNFWYLQTLNFTTQDQIGFPYVVQKLNMMPYTFPDNVVKNYENRTTTLFFKHPHGL